LSEKSKNIYNNLYDLYYLHERRSLCIHHVNNSQRCNCEIYGVSREKAGEEEKKKNVEKEKEWSECEIFPHCWIKSAVIAGRIIALLLGPGSR